MKTKFLLFFNIFFLAGILQSQNWYRIGPDFTSSPYANRIYEITEINGKMYAVGSSWNGMGSPPDSDYAPAVYEYDGTNWVKLGGGFTSSQYVVYDVRSIVEYNGEIYIGGYFLVNGTGASSIAKWDDSNNLWQPVGGTPNGSINELTVYGGKLYAGGNFEQIGAVTGLNNIASWDGTTWSAVGTGLSISTTGIEDQVKVMTVYNGKLIVGGTFSTAGGELVHNIASWDGTAWSYLNGHPVNGGGGIGSASVNDICVRTLQEFNGNLYIGGYLTKYYNNSYTSSTVVPNNLVVWNGTTFSAPAKATPSMNTIEGMTVFNNRLYIIGLNTSKLIHSWNGNSIWNWENEGSYDIYTGDPRCMYSNATNVFYGNGRVHQYYDPIPLWSASTATLCAGESVTFTDNSSGSNTITNWDWTFEGGTPASYNGQTPPPIMYAANGTFDVTLAVTSSDGTETIVKTDMIKVADDITIQTQPTNQTTCSGVNIAFNSWGTSSTGSVAHQWQVNDGSGFIDLVNGGPNSISGATVNNMSYTPLPGDNGYTFRCKFTKCTNVVYSDVVTLTVSEAPVINVQPSTRSICVSGDTHFKVSASVSTGSISYQWQYRTGYSTYADLTNGGIYAGVTTDSLIITGVDNTWGEVYEADNSDGVVSANYRCVVTANGCTVNSTNPYLYIYDAPTVVTDPLDVSVCNSGSGINTSFSVTTTYGTSIPSYQWQVDSGSGYVNITPDVLYSNTTTWRLILTGATSALTGNLYRCEVGGCATPVYSAAARLTIDDQPVIIQNPTHAKVCEGVDTSFSVGVTGVNLNYQWQLRTGATYTNLTDDATYVGTNTEFMEVKSPTQLLDGNKYRCIITSENGLCTVNTSEYSLSILTPPSMAQQYADRKICENQSTTFGVSTTNWNGTLYTRQWQVKLKGASVYTDLTNGAEYSNVTNSTLTILAATAAMDSAKYRCVIYGCTAAIYSPDADLYINKLPVVTQDPQDQIACAGGTATFTAAGTGTNVTYRWECDYGTGSWSSASGGNQSTYTTPTLNVLYDGYKYRCILRSENPCTQTVMTIEADLSVTGITVQPVSNSSNPCYGDTVSFTVTAINAISYQWLENGTPLSDGGIYSGVITDSLVISGVNTTVSGKVYQCKVTGSCGDVTSNNANMTTIYGGPKPVINVNGGTDLSQNTQLYPDYNGSDYEWYLNGVLYNTGTFALSPNHQGSYTVVVIQNGCRSEESDSIVITDVNGVGIKENTINNSISIYPNPVNDQLMIEGEGFKIESIKIINVTGETVSTITKNTKVIDVSGLSKGLYFLQIQTENGVGIKRFIKE